ncbi:MAG TPA: type VI secretion system tube protein Hcp [Thermoanaerobaculia bacterium]
MAQVDMFLKLDGVEGESEDPSHPGEIQLEGFRQSLMSPRDASTDQASGKRKWSHLSLRAKVDKSTAMLFKKLATNEKIPTATLKCYKAGGLAKVEYLTITLSDVYVVKVQAGELESNAGEVIPHCDFDLSFGKIVITSGKQTEKGGGSGTIVCQDNLMLNT